MASAVPFPLRASTGVFPPIVAADARVPVARSATTRPMLWQLPSHLLCSIIGTCMTTSELRRLVAKVLGRDLQGMTDVEVHTEGVSLAADREPGGRVLHKALDARHSPWVKRLGRSATLADLGDAWTRALASGDVPGAYWAILSHAATDAALTKRVFGDVHMLSHLVGAANRADIRRLTELEAERAALADRLDRQQARLQTVFAERDDARAKLEMLVVERAGSTPEVCGDDELSTLRELVHRQRDELALAAHRQAAVERKAAELRHALDDAWSGVAKAEQAAATLRTELDAIDAAHEHNGREATRERLDGFAILYAGGLAANLASLRAEVERRGATFLHHDGGIEDRSGLLSGLVGRCDVALFPVDCISHEGSLGLKRLCGQYGRPFVALRSAGWSSLVAALDRLARERAEPARAAA